MCPPTPNLSSIHTLAELAQTGLKPDSSGIVPSDLGKQRIGIKEKNVITPHFYKQDPYFHPVLCWAGTHSVTFIFLQVGFPSLLRSKL